MISKFVFLALVIAVVVADQSVEEQWDNFKRTYGKHYSGEEDAERFEIFKENVQRLEELNQKYKEGSWPWKATLNRNADLKESEKPKFHGYTTGQWRNKRSSGGNGYERPKFQGYTTGVWKNRRSADGNGYERPKFQGYTTGVWKNRRSADGNGYERPKFQGYTTGVWKNRRSVDENEYDNESNNAGLWEDNE